MSPTSYLTAPPRIRGCELYGSDTDLSNPFATGDAGIYNSFQPLAKTSLNWCGRGDLNPHAVRHSHLKAACIPISPLPHAVFKPAAGHCEAYASLDHQSLLSRRWQIWIYWNNRCNRRLRKHGQRRCRRRRSREEIAGFCCILLCVNRQP